MKKAIKLTTAVLILICILFNTSVISFSAAYYSHVLNLDVYSDYLKKQNYSKSITVAVIDSGCADIEILQDKTIGGYDFVDNDNDPSNDISSDSHGTFIASIISEITDGLPIRIMPVRILENQDVSKDNLIRGIKYAVDNGADLINISIGGTLSSCSDIDLAIAYAEEKNVTVVVSAGNAKKEISNFCPAHNESCITVSSVDENNEFVKRYSNFGSAVDCCAPGENIPGYNANGKQATNNGTSFSAAIISAGTAMIKLQNPDFSAKEIQDTLKQICNDLGEKGKDIYYGYGLPDFKKMIPIVCNIKNDLDESKAEYYSTVTLTAEISVPWDCDIKWYKDNNYYCSGDTFTAKEVTEDFEVFYIADFGNQNTVQSQILRIPVKHSLIDKFLVFIKLTFEKIISYLSSTFNFPA